MKPVSKLFALFCALALLFPACVTVRDCDGNRYRTLKINGMRWMADLPVLLFFLLPAEMDSRQEGRQGNQARQGHYQHNIATSPVHYLEQQRQT